MHKTNNHAVFPSHKIQSLLQRLHAEASAADQAFLSKFSTMPVAEREALQDDYRRFYGLAREAYIPVAEEFGRLLYLMARATSTRTIVEFGTGAGVKTKMLLDALASVRSPSKAGSGACLIKEARFVRAKEVKARSMQRAAHGPIERT